ncbi:MAG: VCBS repeat-containing protein, partial [Segetibacter sp.]
MTGKKNNALYFVSLILLIICFACKSKPKEPALFKVLDNTRTGLDFNNKLTATDSLNMFKYMYFYNGAGVGAGDFNNDGLIDLFFSANQGQSRMYLNKGNLTFTDVTTEAKIPDDGSWSTGVSVVDINNDGLLDIYVCKVGQFETLHGKNQLLVCQGKDKNGIPVYADKAKEYGLDFSGFSTQAAFFDYDLDGDLDMFLLNHAVHQNGSFAERKKFIGTYYRLNGDRIYRNNLTTAPPPLKGGKANAQGRLQDVNKNSSTRQSGVSASETPPLMGGEAFTDVTKQTGINSSAIGYGLGIAIADINLDGYPDLYIGNDFHENDYLYINQRDGTFKEELTKQIEHTSQFSMGVDIADINNDAYPEIISMDMLPYDPYVLKRSLGDDEYNIFNMKIGYGYNPQYARNSLQLNRRNGMFSEVAMFAGVEATDWSWAPLWMDFDNDGLKDLFVSNGIPKRLNDIDYVNYVSNDDIQSKIKSNSIAEKEMAIIDNFPQIKIKNRFFKNTGNLSFKDIVDQVENDKITYSNGSVYADFDNDGDLDIAVNNIDDPVLLYANKTNDHHSQSFLQLQLKGTPGNINATGAKAVVYANGGIRTYEKFPVKGFLSSMETPILIGLEKTKVDSIVLVWPDNTYEKIQLKPGVNQVSLKHKEGLPKFNYVSLASYVNNTKPFENITAPVNLLYKHTENPFNEFDREPLIPFMVSRDGPALAVHDANGDGLDDVFIGSSKGTKSAIFFQQATGRFIKSKQPSIENDSTYEDVDACWADVNNDKHVDLIVASGGNEYYGNDEHLTPRVYLNDGKANFSRLNNAFDSLYLTASVIVPNDINGDGYIDLFIGGRAVPWEYGQIPQSYLLLNDKTGHFKDVTARYSKELAHAGFVKHAVWEDIDKDGDKDLILALEWNGIYAFINDKGTFKKKMLTGKRGWWNFTVPIDVDGDGDMDLIAGNVGLNNRLKPSEQQPVKLYYNDFDGNGKKEQVLTYYL